MIRNLRTSDAAVMAALHTESFDAGWPEEDMAEHVEQDIALGFFHENDLVGFILMRMSYEQSEILTISVDAKHRRTGIAAKLLTAGEAAIKTAGGQVIFLEVAEDNPSAIALYDKAGYESFGRRPAYYKRAGGRVAARLFQKKL